MPAPSTSQVSCTPTRALVVDLWGTLTVPSAPGERDRAVAEVGELLGVDGPLFARRFAELFPQRCRGEFGDLEDTLEAVAALCGGAPSPEAVQRAARHRMKTQLSLMRFRDDAMPTLELFRRAGWRVGVVTDSTCETERLWDGFEIARSVDAAVFSCALGASKPDERLFRAAADDLKVPLSECVYVADGRTGELAAAASLGMRAIQLITDTAYPDAEQWTGETVPTLAALSGIVLTEEQQWTR